MKKIFIISYSSHFELHIDYSDAQDCFEYNFKHVKVNNNAWLTLVEAAKAILAQDYRNWVEEDQKKNKK